jgi:hypothetical protein
MAPKVTTIFPFGGSSITKKDDLVLDREIVGGKGLGLQVMGSIGIDIPPGKDARLLLFVTVVVPYFDSLLLFRFLD